MRILLINSNRFKNPEPVIPIGLCYIASSIEKAGYAVKVLDLCFSNSIEEDIKNAINDFNPEIIGISIRNIDTTTVINPIFFIDIVKKEVIDPCKKYFKGTIVLGGSSIGISGLEILEYLDLEYAIHGDGEKAMIEFISRIEKKEPLNKLDGLIIKKEDYEEVNSPAYIDDLDNLPFPRVYKYIDLSKYRLYKVPIQIQTKRGCELNCIYCTYNRIEGKKYRLRNPLKIIEEIEDIIKNTGIREIEFVDSTFNLPLDHAKSILKLILENKMKLKITAMGINPKCVDEEFVDLMKKTGFYEIFVTVESCSDKTLKTLQKNFNKEDIIKAGKFLKKKRITTRWCLLLGAPEETEETITESFKTINKISSLWDMIDIAIGIRVYNGAPIIDKFVKNKNSKYLMPIPYIPADINIEKIRTLSLYHTLKNHNYFMHDNVVSFPFFVQSFFRIFFPKTPIWKFYVYSRFIEKITGISYIISFFYKFLKRNKIKFASNSN